MNRPLIILALFFIAGQLFPAAHTLPERRSLVARALAALSPRLDPGREHRILILHPSTATVLGSVGRAGCFDELRPPGSLFKLLTAAHLLEDNRLPRNHTGYCKGRFYLLGNGREPGTLIHEDVLVPGRGDYYKCSLLHGHGPLQLGGALAHSCNVFFYALHGRIDWERLGSTFHRSGLSLHGGRITMPQLLTRRVLGTVGETTVVSLASAAAFVTGILNDGLLLRLQETGRPQPAGRWGNAALFAVLREGMRDCVRYGTGKAAAGAGLPAIAGKTGTARQAGEIFRTDGWFISYAPFHKPEILIAAFSTDTTGNKVPLENSVLLYRQLQQAGYFGR